MLDSKKTSDAPADAILEEIEKLKAHPGSITTEQLLKVIEMLAKGK